MQSVIPDINTEIMKKSLFSAIAFILFSCTSTQQNKKYSAEVETRIREVENNLAGWVQTGEDDRWTLADRMKKYRINGVSIAVIHDYKIEWARGYGFADISENRPVTSATLFQAASISKSVNSLGVLRLVQEGKLDLNTDINNYLVSWKFPYDDKSNGKKITILNLLSHTGGLTIHGFPGYAIGDSLPSLVLILNGQKPANTEAVRSFEEPGSAYSYSGGGTTITQLIIEDLTHQPYEAYMKRYVLDPLGMTASSYSQPPDKRKAELLSAGYKADGKEVAGKYHVYPEQAAAGLWTNPTDLCKYVIETQLAYKGESSKILTPEMTKLRLTPVKEDAALGTFVNSRVTGSYKYFNHNGGNEGFSCTAIGCRDSGDGVVIMTNSDNSSILEEIANSVATVYKWKDYYLPESKKVVSVDKSVLRDYAGLYDFINSKIRFTLNDTGLIVNPYGNVRWQLLFTSDSDFFVRDARISATFRRDGAGKVTGILTDGQVMKKIE
jgi:CubicO group peptidase (beta-lactamase class C family)